MVVNLDGSGYSVLPVATADYQGRYPSWISPTAIAAMDGQYYARVLRVGTSGTVQYLVPNADTVVLEVWPQASRDGSWIYFGGLVPGYSTAGVSIWRVQPTGTGLQRVSPSNVDGQGDTEPSPSPDGTKIAVATTRFGGFTLAVIDVATAQITNLNVPGQGPRWAPAGDTIAYLSGSEIWLVSSGGGGARRVSPLGRSYGLGIDWSPDRHWIIARGSMSLELIEVATGQFLTLPGLPGGPYQPAFKP
jgi:Tol biopolymer transport system component